ncbi:helix-turn-helix domain-containing protein [Cyclobacterium plantarum]|uniref:Helix-turn-helix domain-containing protein n=1 Tax=Cyclobacterium plantarum TaxID=2716263 RepID=A0ABX0HEP2_9BACT|nr:helix-turn-helix domain-containing protein [Cyclobacterium plantarum]NHE58642.1 helix-turn-helix domain-containing protein [Cyclobacterium plantarum]
MNKNQLAHKVKLLRKRRGFSQEALAELAGLSLRTIQRVENENRKPSGDSLKKMATALGVDLDYFMEWEPNENANFLLILAFSPILCIVNPILAVIVPWVLWILNKKQIKGVHRLGLKVLSIQVSWLIVYFVFRTLNVLRIGYIILNKQAFVGKEWNSFLYDVNTHSYLKIFFISINIGIIFFITYKTHKTNHLNNSKISIQVNPS